MLRFVIFLCNYHRETQVAAATWQHTYLLILADFLTVRIVDNSDRQFRDYVHL